jgi:hypothetical protein
LGGIGTNDLLGSGLMISMPVRMSASALGSLNLPVRF